jgi:hypothetical protein
MEREEAMRVAAMLHDEPVGPLALPAALRPAVELAAAAAGQWRMAGGGMAPMRPVGLDFVAVDAIARWMGLTPTPRLLADLRGIEAAALALFRTDR